MSVLAVPSRERMRWYGATFILLCGLANFALAIHEVVVVEDGNMEVAIFAIVIFVVTTIIGAYFLSGISLQAFRLGKAGMEFSGAEPLSDSGPAVQRKTLDEETLDERESLAREAALPDADSPRFSSLDISRASEILVRPSAYPMTPMYMLDHHYKIIDWNAALTLAFDRTMEGRFGHSVLEWTYFLDNYEEVLNHGREAFSDPDALPGIDVETIRYTSLRYGPLSAVKRAYKIPDDTGLCLAWLVTLDLRFEQEGAETFYKRDLIHLLGQDQLWSEYAIDYDELLNETRVYRELVDIMLGDSGSLGRIAHDARVLDLGAGTGNLCYQLMARGPERLVVALENNRMMLDLLRAKCKPFLRSDPDGPGVLAVKQDVTSLFGLDDDMFDLVLANNVLYTLEDPAAAMEQVRRVLKPGGELRMSGPHEDSDPDVLFRIIHDDLVASHAFERLRRPYERVYNINKFRLAERVNSLSRADAKAAAERAGFKAVTLAPDRVYGGQSMLLSARK